MILKFKELFRIGEYKMKENLKGIILIMVGVVALIGSFYLYNFYYLGAYAIIGVSAAVILILFGIVAVINGSTTKLYERNIKRIIKTLGSNLIKSNSVPRLIGKNIILVEKINDLVDAQLEIKKPVCYYKQTESCAFMLLDDKRVYVYIEKLSPDVISPIEIEIDDIRYKQKKSENLDSEMLRDIEKTTIIKLSNKKSFKVSPVKKDNKMELSDKSIDSVINDTEIL